LQDIALQRAQAEESVYARQQDMEDRAAAIRAETLAKYGPEEEKTKTTEDNQTGDEAAKAAAAAEAKRKAEEEAAKRAAGIAQVKAMRRAEF